jgi:peptidoglycan/xylan/chitin deacetylase (PgdA/CDA1 family)
MTRLRIAAARHAVLGLVFAVAAAMPAASPGLSLAPVTAGNPADLPDGLPGLISHHAGAAPAMPHLEIGELGTGIAPAPSGPTTYLPILLYHYIRVNPNPADRVGFGLSTPPAMFAEQMQYLADHDFTVISLHLAVLAIKDHKLLPRRSVVLTFDDGYQDFFTVAAPILARHSFPATDFVVTGRMGLPGFMTPVQVLDADRMGFDIGAHTVDHVALARLSPAQATWEMRQSQLTLSRWLGHPISDFAYPYGSFNTFDETEARLLGFETAVSTLTGAVHSADQLMDLSRIRIGGGMSLGTFAHLVGGSPPTPAELHL